MIVAAEMSRLCETAQRSREHSRDHKDTWLGCCAPTRFQLDGIGKEAYMSRNGFLINVSISTRMQLERFASLWTRISNMVKETRERRLLSTPLHLSVPVLVSVKI